MTLYHCTVLLMQLCGSTCGVRRGNELKFIAGDLHQLTGHHLVAVVRRDRKDRLADDLF